MIATYDSATGRLVVNGRNKPGTRRFWIVVLDMRTEELRETVTLRPDDKMTLAEMHDEVMSHVVEFEDEVGPCIKINFRAIAR